MDGKNAGKANVHFQIHPMVLSRGVQVRLATHGGGREEGRRAHLIERDNATDHFQGTSPVILRHSGKYPEVKGPIRLQSQAGTELPKRQGRKRHAEHLTRQAATQGNAAERNGRRAEAKRFACPRLSSF